MNPWGFSIWVLFGSLLSRTHINWALHSGWELVVCIIARQIMPLDFSMETWHEICPGNRKLSLQIYSLKKPKPNQKTNKNQTRTTPSPPPPQAKKPQNKTKQKIRQNQPPIFVPALYFLSSIPGSDHWRILGTHTCWGWTPQTVSWGPP